MRARQVPAARQLGRYFRRNGYVRRQNSSRLASEGYERYKKGDEVRLVAETGAELRLIRRLLRELGFKPGRPFRRGRQYRQPVYGRQEVERFLEVIDAEDA